MIQPQEIAYITQSYIETPIYVEILVVVFRTNIMFGVRRNRIKIIAYLGSLKLLSSGGGMPRKIRITSSVSWMRGWRRTCSN